MSELKGNLMVGGGCFSFIAIFVIIYYPLALWTDRNLDFWFSYFKETPVDVPFWLSLLVTIFGPFDLLFNIIGELARIAVT